MKMITGVTVATATLLTLAGCSSGDEGGDVKSGQDVADMIGCTDFTNDSEEVFVSEGGSCDLDGEQLGVYYFADKDARDSYVDVGADFGGNYLVGDNWVVDGPSTVLEGLQEKHGGDLSAE